MTSLTLEAQAHAYATARAERARREAAGIPPLTREARDALLAMATEPLPAAATDASRGKGARAGTPSDRDASIGASDDNAETTVAPVDRRTMRLRNGDGQAPGVEGEPAAVESPSSSHAATGAPTSIARRAR